MENAGQPAEYLTAAEMGLVGCRSCGRAAPVGTRTCSRCGERLHPNDVSSLQTVYAWMAAGIVCYIPANLYPMLITRLFGKTTDSTIAQGVIDLAQHGALVVATIVFVASILIPIGKFAAITYLALAVRGVVRRRHKPSTLHHLYEVVDFIGRWSMIDVFVVAILAALVQLNFVASIKPGIAAVSFALSVVFTMLAAQAFDPRLIWTRLRQEQAA